MRYAHGVGSCAERISTKKQECRSTPAVTGISRVARISAHSPSGEQAPRSPSGRCEPNSGRSRPEWVRVGLAKKRAHAMCALFFGDPYGKTPRLRGLRRRRRGYCSNPATFVAVSVAAQIVKKTGHQEGVLFFW